MPSKYWGDSLSEAPPPAPDAGVTLQAEGRGWGCFESFFSHLQFVTSHSSVYDHDYQCLCFSQSSLKAGKARGARGREHLRRLCRGFRGGPEVAWPW